MSEGRGVREMNKVLICGNLGADPEIRDGKSGEVANLRVATTEKWLDRSGDRQEHTEWHRVVFFGRTAGVCREYLFKGSKVLIEGRIQTRKWQGQDGQDRYATEIVGGRLEMLGSPKGGARREHSESRRPSVDFDEEIPF